MEQIAEAHRYVDTGQKRGTRRWQKVVAEFCTEGHVLIHDALDPAEVEHFRPHLVEAVYDIAQQAVEDNRAKADRNAFIRSE